MPSTFSVEQCRRFHQIPALQHGRKTSVMTSEKQLSITLKSLRSFTNNVLILLMFSYILLSMPQCLLSLCWLYYVFIAWFALDLSLLPRQFFHLITLFILLLELACLPAFLGPTSPKACLNEVQERTRQVSTVWRISPRLFSLLSPFVKKNGRFPRAGGHLSRAGPSWRVSRVRLFSPQRLQSHCLWSHQTSNPLRPGIFYFLVCSPIIYTCSRGLRSGRPRVALPSSCFGLAMFWAHLLNPACCLVSPLGVSFDFGFDFSQVTPVSFCFYVTLLFCPDSRLPYGLVSFPLSCCLYPLLHPYLCCFIVMWLSLEEVAW